MARANELDEATIQWVDAEKDYQLAVADDKLICRNPKGKRLASLPKWLKETELATQLSALRDWLDQHRQECFDTIQAWMLRSLPIPGNVLAAVWADPCWRDSLRNLVVCPLDGKGTRVQESAGFLREVSPKKGVGIVDLDGETQWLRSPSLCLPHPILLDELQDFRELATELALEQKLSQLYRQTWFADDATKELASIQEFARAKFEQLNHVSGLCRRLGYRVKGGNAVCPVWEGGKLVEARFWIGADYPEEETWTGDLLFTDEKERSLTVREIGPVSYSEGMRMAAAIYAKRVVKENDGD